MEIQQQLPHPTQHMNTGNVIQIDMPDFNPDIDGGLPTKEHEETQGLDSHIQQPSKKFNECDCGLAGHDTCQNPTTTGPGQ